MLRRFLHALVSHPAVYRCCQFTIGAGPVTHRIAAHVDAGNSLVLDIGAGTGYARRMWPAEARYVALDVDRAMLSASHQPLAVQSDATELPIATGSVDTVLCKQVSHHIPEELLDRLFTEIRRVLRPGGRFLFLDAVRTGRTVSDLLWRYDRGAHPRSEADLRQHLESCFTLVHREAHWHLHQYLLLVLVPAADVSEAASDTGAASGHRRF
jgi:SAM-dependent methyltransferase